MAMIDDIRNKYPQYNDLSDEELANSFHKKFYSDMPQEQFYKKIGYEKTSPVKDFINKRVKQYLEPDIGTSVAAGAAQGIANILPGVANLGIHAANGLGANIQPFNAFHFAPDNMAAKVGEIGSMAIPFVGAEKLLGMAGNAIGKIPEAYSGFKAVANAMRAPALGAATGAIQDPENQALGAIIGGTTAGVGGLANKYVPKIYRALSGKEINNFIDKFSPEKHAQELMDKLGVGSENYDKNSKSLASDIFNKYKERQEESGIYLNHALDRAGEEKILSKPDPIISTAKDELKDITDKARDLKIGDLFEAFDKNPTFRNAHNLQSEMGNLQGQLEKNNNKSIADRAEIAAIKKTRDELKGHIDNFLKNRDLNSNENLSPTYKKGIDLYRENVSPYLSDKKLRSIVRGGKTSVKNLHSVFENPSDIRLDSGEIKVGPINKLLQDLPSESKNKILFSAMGGRKADANALMNSLNSLSQKGFSEQFNPEIKEGMNALNKKLKNKENLIKAAKYSLPAAGALGGSFLGAESINHLRNL